MPVAAGVAPSASHSLFADDISRRTASVSSKPVPRIHHSSVLPVAQNPSSAYALQVMKHPNPLKEGLAMEARIEAAGPECIVPGQIAPVKLLGLKVFPIDVNLKFMEPFGRQVASIRKFMDSTTNINIKASTIEDQ